MEGQTRCSAKLGVGLQGTRNGNRPSLHSNDCQESRAGVPLARFAMTGSHEYRFSIPFILNASTKASSRHSWHIPPLRIRRGTQ
jgi:hypothetical protein